MATTITNTQPDHVASQSYAHDEAAGMVENVAALVSPPEVCLRIFDLLQSPDSSARDIGDVIMQDPNLTARLLRVVNSSFYGVGRKVDTVSRAIAIVGIRDLYNLVIAVSAVKRFNAIASDSMNMDVFWRHSLFTALIARALAKRAGILHPERMFVAGLLHEVGALVLYHKMPRLAQEHLLLAGGDESAIFEQELETLGFTHAELGANLLEMWNIPQALQNAVRFHPAPQTASEPREPTIVYAAGILANRSGIGAFVNDAIETREISDRDWIEMGFPQPPSPEQEAEFITFATEEFAEMASTILSGRE